MALNTRTELKNRAQPQKKTPVHYVDNKLLLAEMIKYRNAVLEWKQTKKELEETYTTELEQWEFEKQQAEAELRNFIPEKPEPYPIPKKPLVPRYVGESLVKIANRLSTMPGFVGYPYREEMIGDGIVNCIEYIDNYNPAKSTNPFSYFTQIIYFAFIRRIKKEQKITSIKVKAYDQMILELELEGMSSEIQGMKSTLSNTRNKTDA